MFTNPATRKRYVSQPGITVGGLSRILQGVFGLGNPAVGLASQRVTLDAAHVGGPYTYAEGDIWTPGTGNWYMDPAYDGPLMTVWGNAFLRQPNTFSVRQPRQVYTAANVTTVGIGGQVAGQMWTQPLSDPNEGQ